MGATESPRCIPTMSNYELAETWERVCVVPGFPCVRQSQNIQDVMTPNPFLVSTETPVAEAARMMRQVDVGSLIVLEEGAVCGIVTDRDITIRAVAEERDGPTTRVGEVCSREPLTLSLDDSIEQAIEVMRTHPVAPVAGA
jgi:CBS domain-containing protein